MKLKEQRVFPTNMYDKISQGFQSNTIPMTRSYTIETSYNANREFTQPEDNHKKSIRRKVSND